MNSNLTARFATTFPALWLALGLVALIRPALAAGDPAGLEFFESKVRPLLIDNCYSCHSQQSAKVKGGLLVDTRDGLLKGGDTGPAIVPGNLDDSLLIKAIRYNDDKLQMPPKDKKLSADAIAIFEAWVKMGAPDPRVAAPGALSKFETIRDKSKTHWAFQPVHEPVPPAVKNPRFVQTPVDNFVLARLETAHLRPSPRADKRTLIRRATFDLIGLPPTSDEVAAFIADKSPDAFARVVDRLLASPHYGERWGRHWLDVARYADTKGYVFEEDRHYAYSYTYRDYVIRAFNEDLPYDQFIREQIAADLLPNNHDKRSLAALGYLTLGRRFVNNIHDIIDDRIDVVCRGMMGLTVTCARCHDHKYDPIPTRDYYGLYGVFDSSYEPAEEPLLGMEVPADLKAKYLAEHQKRVDARDNYRRDNKRKLDAELHGRVGDYLFAAHEAKISGDKIAVDTAAHKYNLHTEILHRWIASLDEWHKATNAIFAPWFAFTALAEKDFAGQARPLAATFAANANKTINPLVAHEFAGAPPATLKDVADRYGKLFGDIAKQWQQALVATNTPVPAALPEAAAEAVRQILYADSAPPVLAGNDYDRLYDVPTQQQIRKLQRDIEELDATDPGAPPRAMALEDKSDPHDVHVFVRGNSGNEGPDAPREFLEILSGTNRQPFKVGSGRLELAEDIASTNNPLTARVFVNRVWLHHFGSPLVSTPSDFGLRSDPPTNPQLLDYLAARFMAGGWSVKKLQRLIMLSATYQQSSDDNTLSARIDPGNQFYWRMNRQRLEFEPMRDTLLAVSGKLNLATGGRSVDIISPDSTRRTVYGFVDRQNLPDLFRAFDFASPDTTSPRRFYTTVPQQALFMMNNLFVIEQAKSLVHRSTIGTADSEEQRIRELYQLAYQRDPTADEIALAHQFLHHPPTVESEPVPVVANTNWLFGYGAFNDTSKRVAKFRKLPFYDGRAFQGGPNLPDPKLGWVVVSGTGGHPGNDQQHASIRRWIAPRDGAITIHGDLAHPDKRGDGVRGRIVSSHLGVINQWLVHNAKKETQVEKIQVKAGDKIDFVTDCRDDPGYDSYTWSPIIRYVADGKTLPGQRMEWNALLDFAEASQSHPVTQPSLNAWERYAQVLLLANELVFVD